MEQVHAHAHAHAHDHGGGSPAAVPGRLTPGTTQENRIFGFWTFLGGEAVLFASLIGTFLALWGQFNGGPKPDELFNLTLVGVATVTLLTSSMTGAFATHHAQQGNLRGVQAWLAVTIVLGEIFLGIQGWEFWSYIMNEGFAPSTSAFASAFFTLVGFHGLHVTFGVFWLAAWLINSFLKDDVTQEDASRLFVAGLYWHFVDVVWVVIFTVVYLTERLVF